VGASNRFSIVPNFIDSGSDKPASVAFPQSVKTCLFVGSLLTLKGVEYLLAAVPEIIKKHPELSLIIVGDGPEKERFEKIVDHLLIREQVRFVGRVACEATSEWYRQAGIVVVPSLDEAQGIVVLEAFSHGLPVVASNVGGIPDMVQDGRNGLLVPPGDSAAIAAAICRLFDDRELWTRCAQDAYETSLRYSWDQGISQILDLYKEVLNG
jgi:glycosyltransferase involved in cell wall biosynthesis